MTLIYIDYLRHRGNIKKEFWISFETVYHNFMITNAELFDFQAF